MTRVVRIRRRSGRVVQDCDVYIGRSCNMGGWRLTESVWVNPFSVKQYGREEALRRYREHILQRPDLLARLPELKDKTLGCWCHPEPCHGDILVKLVNGRSAGI